MYYYQMMTLPLFLSVFSDWIEGFIQIKGLKTFLIFFLCLNGYQKIFKKTAGKMRERIMYLLKEDYQKLC